LAILFGFFGLLASEDYNVFNFHLSQAQVTVIKGPKKDSEIRLRLLVPERDESLKKVFRNK
jgi:hypothetical protein